MPKFQLEKLKKQFEEDGFVVLKNYLDVDQLDDLRDRAINLSSRLMKDQETKDKYHHVLKSLNRHDSWFDDELKNGSHIEILEALLGFKPNGVSAAWFDRPIGDDIGIEPHKDAYGSDKSEKVGATIWLSLDKASRDNGCLSYLRGSHKKVYPDIIPIPGINKDSENAFFAELNPGDAVVHSSSIVHWSEGNQSLMPRRAVSYFYFGAKI